MPLGFLFGFLCLDALCIGLCLCETPVVVGILPRRPNNTIANIVSPFPRRLQVLNDYYVSVTTGSEDYSFKLVCAVNLSLCCCLCISVFVYPSAGC